MGTSVPCGISSGERAAQCGAKSEAASRTLLTPLGHTITKKVILRCLAWRPRGKSKQRNGRWANQLFRRHEFYRSGLKSNWLAALCPQTISISAGKIDRSLHTGIALVSVLPGPSPGSVRGSLRLNRHGKRVIGVIGIGSIKAGRTSRRDGADYGGDEIHRNDHRLPAGQRCSSAGNHPA